MASWIALIVVLVLAGAVAHWAWERHRPRPVERHVFEERSNVRVLRTPEEKQEAARRAADYQMETVRRMAAAEERWREMSKEE